MYADTFKENTNAKQRMYTQEFPDLNNQYLRAISSDFIKVADTLKEASSHIRKQGGYRYPVFPVSQTPHTVGALLIEKENRDNQWIYHVTYLDALVQSGLVEEDKIAAFQSTYKSPDEFCCLLVIDTDFAKVVYIPYPAETT